MMKQINPGIRMFITAALLWTMVLSFGGCGTKAETKPENQASDSADDSEVLTEQPVETESEDSAQSKEVYRAVYDETGLLWSEELERLSTDILPSLTEKYGIDMRVDVLTDMGDFEDLSETAAFLYQEYEYGSPYGRNGVTLTLLVHEDDTGVTLDAWHPYAAGESWELTTNGTWNICRESDIWLAQEAWEGDRGKDAKMLAGAVNDMAVGLEKFVLAGGVGSTIWNPLTESLVEPAATAQTVQEDTYWAAFEWYSEDGQGAEGPLALPTEDWWLDLLLRADGTAKFRDVHENISLMDDATLSMIWERAANGDIYFYNRHSNEPIFVGSMSGDILTLDYRGFTLSMKQDEVPESVGEKYVPAELVGTWLMASGETEGWEWEVMPGQMESLVFREVWTADSVTLVADSEFENPEGNLEENFYGREITILEEPLYEGCENNVWSVCIGAASHREENSSPGGTEYYVTLLDQNTLLMQRFYTLDGVAAVSYQKFCRIMPQVSRWEIESSELEGSSWECAWYRGGDGVETKMPPGMDDFYLHLDMNQVCWLGQLSEGNENYTDTQGGWQFGKGGVLLLSGEGYESPEGYCPEFWYPGAVFGNIFETEDGFTESYEMYLYYDGGVICLERAEDVG